jgi:hypothetical protein
MIRPVVTYACETWILSARDINNDSVFERQILRKIYLTNWVKGRNNELQKLRKGEDIVEYIKAQRIKW